MDSPNNMSKVLLPLGKLSQTVYLKLHDIQRFEGSINRFKFMC